MGHYFTNEKLDSNLRKIAVNINDKNFSFYVDNGVFSKSALDFGSRTLINSVIEHGIEEKKDLLDVGCGYGVIGIILSSFFNLNTDMIDINKRAIHLSQMNIKENNLININAFESNIYDNVVKKYDYIITNPPIRAGKEVVYKIIFGAKQFLNQNGTLFFVINKDQGAKSIIKDLNNEGIVEIIGKNKGFIVARCTF